MRYSGLLGLAAAMIVAAGPAAQGHPNFSGHWVFDREHSLIPGRPGTMTISAMLGDSFTAEQNDATLTFHITAGRLEVTATYRLDGSESRNVSPEGVVVTSRASWDGDRLVIVSTSTSNEGGQPLTIDSRRVLWIDADGRLVLERTGTPEKVVIPTRSAYRKE
jgi:hypothetical protein